MSNTEREMWLGKAKVLAEALPYMREFHKKSFVIKYGGHAMGEEHLAHEFARDIVLLKQVGINPVVVHGGGPQINSMLKRLNVQSNFIDGLRVTDQATVEVVEMVLSGTINKQIVSAINAAGGFAIGVSGKDGNLLRARRVKKIKKDPVTGTEQVIDYGFVGEPAEINPHILNFFASSDIIPVIAPVGIGFNNETLNVNADTAAGAIASSVHAARMLMLTDVPGVLDKNGQRIPELSVGQAKALIKDGTISGGMIPKVETCINAVENGVEAAVIVDGRVPNAVLLEVFTPHGAGTLIRF